MVSRVPGAIFGIVVMGFACAFWVQHDSTNIVIAVLALVAASCIAVWFVGQGQGGTSPEIDEATRRLQEGMGTQLGSVDDTTKLARDLAASIQEVVVPTPTPSPRAPRSRARPSSR